MFQRSRKILRREFVSRVFISGDVSSMLASKSAAVVLQKPFREFDLARPFNAHAMRRRAKARADTTTSAGPPRWIEPQFCKFVEKPPIGPGWVHEIKFDGYRMAVRIDGGKAQLLTRSGLDWTDKYPHTAAALAKLPAKNAYIDGEPCGVRPADRSIAPVSRKASVCAMTPRSQTISV